MSDPRREQGWLLLALILIILLTVLGSVLLSGCGAPEPKNGTIQWACPKPQCCHRYADTGGCWDYGCCDPEPVRAK